MPTKYQATGLAAAVLLLMATSGGAQNTMGYYNNMGPTDINVHRVALFRNSAVEDHNLARSKRNVLVSLICNCVGFAYERDRRTEWAWGVCMHSTMGN